MKFIDLIRNYFKPKPLPTFQEWCDANGYSTDPKVEQLFVVRYSRGDKLIDNLPITNEEKNIMALENMRKWLLDTKRIQE